MKKEMNAIALMLLLVAGNALAAGFEKNTFWSGQYAGFGDAAVSVVSGSQSLYFNPAGMAGQTGWEVSGNFSPTFSSFTGALAGNPVTSNTGFSPIYGVTASYGVTSDFAIGVGSYISGGTKADYDPVNIGAPNNAALNADLSLNEFVVGAAYQVVPGFKIGAAWRGVLANATFNQPGGVQNPSPPPAVLPIDTSFSGLSQFVASGFKIGAEWASADKVWNVGANFRSNVDLDNLSGTVTTTNLLTGSQIALGGNTASLSTSFPAQYSLGVAYAISSTVKGILQYDFTNYQKVSSIGVTTGGTVQAPIATNWNNLNNGRIGFEFTGVPDWTLRMGYVYTSEVVPADNASPIFSAPGAANTFTLGAGTELCTNFHADAAFEFSKASGSGSAIDPGSFSDQAYALHLGGTYRF